MPCGRDSRSIQVRDQTQEVGVDNVRRGLVTVGITHAMYLSKDGVPQKYLASAVKRIAV